MKRLLEGLALLGIASVGGACTRESGPSQHPAFTRELEATTPADESRRREEIVWRVRATLEEMTFFDVDRADIRPDARRTLNAKTTLLQADSSLRLRIEGHADERGTQGHNYELGLARADEVKRFLVETGIDPARIDVLSFGENLPVDRGHNERAWARNRRTEFRILAGRTVTMSAGSGFHSANGVLLTHSEPDGY